MNQAVNGLQRIGMKLFTRPEVPVDAHAFIPIFHHWIQSNAVDDLLIDVADYTHLVEGPSVLLVGHEGNYVLDFCDGRPGLSYYRKQPISGSLSERLATICRTVLQAGKLLETETTLGDGFRFRGSELEFIANDRLTAPSTDITLTALRPTLTEFLDILYDTQQHEIINLSEVGSRLKLSLVTSHEAPLATLLERIS